MGFFVRSLKAEGLGLDLTAASHGAFRPFRPTMEPGGGEPGHGPRLPHRPEQKTCSCTSSSAVPHISVSPDPANMQRAVVYRSSSAHHRSWNSAMKSSDA